MASELPVARVTNPPHVERMVVATPVVRDEFTFVIADLARRRFYNCSPTHLVLNGALGFALNLPSIFLFRCAADLGPKVSRAVCWLAVQSLVEFPESLYNAIHVSLL